LVKQLVLALLILVTSISVAFANAALNLQEGKWEITTKVEMPGMRMNIPPQKHIQCLTKKDFVPQNTQPGQECKISETTIVGNTVTWTVQCKSQGEEMRGKGTITYSGNSFEGTLTMTMSHAKMEMTSHLSGNRIGDCK